MKNKLLILVISFNLIIFHMSFLITQTKGEPQVNELVNEIKKTIVFLGTYEEKNGRNEISFNATGFLVRIKDVYHLVTAKHVVMEVKDNKYTGKLIDEKMFAFFNMKSGKIGFRLIPSIKEEYNIKWIFHETENVDIAIIPFPIDPKTEDIKVISDNLFLDTKRLFELYDIFFLSYQPGIRIENKLTPIIRSGTIRLINNDQLALNPTEC